MKTYLHDKELFLLINTKPILLSLWNRTNPHGKKHEGFPADIDSVKSPDGRVLRSNRKIRDAFHLRDRFAYCPDLSLREFCSYLADFPGLREAEEARCECVITECKVCDALK